MSVDSDEEVALLCLLSTALAGLGMGSLKEKIKMHPDLPEIRHLLFGKPSCR